MGFWVVVIFIFFVFVLFMRTAIVVPQQSAFIVEKLGRYSKTLDAGFHILMPFVETIRYRHTLKEQAVDIPHAPFTGAGPATQAVIGTT